MCFFLLLDVLYILFRISERDLNVETSWDAKWVAHRAWPSRERWECGLVLRGRFPAEKKGCIALLPEFVQETGVLHAMLQKALLLLDVFFDLNKFLFACLFSQTASSRGLETVNSLTDIVIRLASSWRALAHLRTDGIFFHNLHVCSDLLV